MKKIIITLALLATITLAQETVVITDTVEVQQPKSKVLAKALKLLDVQIPSMAEPELVPYTVAYVDPSTGILLKVDVAPLVAMPEEEKTATAMLVQ